MIDKKQFNGGGNDECYTPAYFVRLILPYIPKHAVIWCPFDTEKSEFVKLITANGNKVVHSHKDNGQDFFDYEPERWDILISNPPFTKKAKILERCLSFRKPFALVMTLSWFQDKKPVALFAKRGLQPQMLMPDIRVQYNQEGKIPFKSIYLCYSFLPNDLIFKVVTDQETLPVENKSLEDYLIANYPKDNRQYNIIMLMFINEYNRLLRTYYSGAVYAFDNQLSIDCFDKEYGGSVTSELFSWLQLIDYNLSCMIDDKQSFELFRKYFDVDDLYFAPRKIYEILEQHKKQLYAEKKDVQKTTEQKNETNRYIQKDIFTKA